MAINESAMTDLLVALRADGGLDESPRRWRWSSRP
jgi:hypothetical protein